jgi:hypothetical protein
LQIFGFYCHDQTDTQYIEPQSLHFHVFKVLGAPGEETMLMERLETMPKNVEAKQKSTLGELSWQLDKFRVFVRRKVPVCDQL